MNRVILTWWSDWLWYELSKLFLENWTEVVCLSRSKPDLNVIHIPTDLSEESSINNAINTIKEKYSKFDCLINCAWVLNVEPLWDINYENLERLFIVNVLAPIILTSNLIEQIKENQADIVNVWSTVGFKAYENQCWYGSSKWAMRWINENLQLELKKTKCRVIWFNPWWFKSRLFEKATWKKEDLSAYMNPVDIAKFMIQILNLPKNMEISEVIITRK